MRANRIWLAIIIVLIASAFYEGRLKPQSRPLYQQGLALYRQGNYEDSLAELERAYEIEPNSTAILVLMDWDQLKLGQYDEAGESFGRAERLDPELAETKLGLAYLGIESGQGQVRLNEVRSLLAQEPRNMDFQLAAATMFRQIGQNREAATMFRSLLGRELYGDLARRNLEQMYGMENLNEPIPAEFPQLSRPEDLQVHFRTQGRYWQRRNGEAWETSMSGA